MLVIGLTGSSGSGKSTVSQFLLEQGFAVINCDSVARDVVRVGSPCLAAIIDTFGETVRGIDGTLNRRVLADIVFHDKNKLEKLNSIMYPQIIADLKEQIHQYRANQTEFVILDAPTLFESGADSLCNCTISVISNDTLRIKRIMERDNIDEAMATSRLRSQHPNEFYTQRSDYVIQNTGSLAQLKQQTQDLVLKLRSRRDYG
ncbi:MAG: dephospho-CoA kinase [Clostridiales bacterium]|nr:dephospho-CoA kinase [Clostridiales bacterium]